MRIYILFDKIRNKPPYYISPTPYDTNNIITYLCSDLLLHTNIKIDGVKFRCKTLREAIQRLKKAYPKIRQVDTFDLLEAESSDYSIIRRYKTQ